MTECKMSSKREFIKIVKSLLAKYKSTPLIDRWKEASSFGHQENVLAYWVRDSEDAVNIVWATPVGIRDITYWPAGQETPEQSAFNYLPFRNIAAFEIREGQDIARHYGYLVNGNFIVRIWCNNNQGNLAWVGDTSEQIKNLHDFINQAFTIYENSLGK